MCVCWGEGVITDKLVVLLDKNYFEIKSYLSDKDL